MERKNWFRGRAKRSTNFWQISRVRRGAPIVTQWWSADRPWCERRSDVTLEKGRILSHHRGMALCRQDVLAFRLPFTPRVTCSETACKSCAFHNRDWLIYQVGWKPGGSRGYTRGLQRTDWRETSCRENRHEGKDQLTLVCFCTFNCVFSHTICII